MTNEAGKSTVAIGEWVFGVLKTDAEDGGPITPIQTDDGIALVNSAGGVWLVTVREARLEVTAA